MPSLEQLRRGELAGVQRLKLACGLTAFPNEIYTLADSLEILDLSGNQLSSLPDDLPRLHKLRVIFCSDNRFTKLPEVLGACAELSMVGFKANRIRTVPAASLPPKLRWLILTDNQIEALPSELGRCRYLQKLMLAGNRLRELPAALANCTRLELLRIAANQLNALPNWLLNLPRLSWLAYAGNPFTESLEVQALNDTPVSAIHWDRLTLREPLGEGASGVIHLADYQTESDERHEVAVKRFKGEVTSDGLPHCEMAACMTAGTHPNLIPVHGKLIGHPEATHGLIMARIDPTFANLAGPPSLESCTRDVYSPETRFTLETALGIARGIAGAAQHLHQRGIMHGDLYGHNILHGGQGQAVIGDFGAASFYCLEDAMTGIALERLEVRAFGCLLAELVERIDPVWLPEPIQRQLSGLVTACLGEIPAERPRFADIVRQLAGLNPQASRQSPP